MYRPKLEKDIRCPLEYGLDLFGGKWKSRILCVLAAQKELRYSVLRREMSNITDAVLATTLKELQNSGLVARRQFDEIPPRVEYFLTEKGKSVIPILQSICHWAGLYQEEGAEPSLPQCQKCGYRENKP
ncbi:helix-turn-helix domain-containing protein [Pseudoflavonifractor sp. MSJ-37]|uniref:winged helix-turn-helix transcriptional regulator n=1 Tax=Pseudoflavonifractor sp. MSJ-37 TaxID=2841531 RepID=UPI001C127760|nr:helix-turn-helix domain-containing protein [Pseudoflavonifractor sp. MSJ-37]MBU5434941.1 helix-turn-helix transcriptional regulator [Pseudoflavonifractor sp. MSJ-37]